MSGEGAQATSASYDEADEIIMTVTKGAEDPTARSNDDVAKRLKSFDLRPIRNRGIDRSAQVYLAGTAVLMIFLLALVLNGFTNSFGMSTHGQLTVAEQEAVEAFREADVDHSGTLSKAEVVQHFNEEQAEIKMSGEEVIPEDPGDVIVPDSNRTIHPDHRGHTGGDSLTIQAQEVLAEGAIARRRLLLRRRR